jgi:predicted nucleotidyltransferase component of viral defense system
MTIPQLEKFSLVGGTALALKFGHRTSIDLDLFSYEKFNSVEIIKSLQEEFGSSFTYEGKHEQFGIFCFIEQIKTDIVYYPHIPIDDVQIISGIKMYSEKDIAAMKIQAILGRGKKKDFWDLYELFQHYSLKQVIEWHKKKFPNQMLAISIPQALTYFTDAEESETPVSLKHQTWEGVKKSIQQKVSDYLK